MSHRQSGRAWCRTACQIRQYLASAAHLRLYPALHIAATTGTGYTLLTSNETTSWVAPGGPDQFLRDLSGSRLKRWAVTGSFAANQLVSVTAPEIVVVFTDDPERLAEVTRL